MPGNLDNYGVSGLDGVKSFPAQPNQRYVLFDKDVDYMYFFTTDGANIKSDIRRCQFIDKPVPKPEDIFASKEDLIELKGEICDVKQSIQQLISRLSSDVSESVSSNNHAGKTASVGNIPGEHGQDKSRIKTS